VTRAYLINFLEESQKEFPEKGNYLTIENKTKTKKRCYEEKQTRDRWHLRCIHADTLVARLEMLLQKELEKEIFT